MESISNILEDNSLQESKKLEMINLLINTKLKNKENIENINIENILTLTTKDIELKWDVLQKIFTSDENLHENINHFIDYFRKTFHNIENQELLARIVLLLVETVKDSCKIQTLFENLGVEKVNEVILNKIFLEKSDYEETRANLKIYIDCLSIDYQAVFFNKLFEFCERNKNVDLLCLTLNNVNIAALTVEKSVFLTKSFWIFLTSSLENCTNFMETQKIILVLETCINLHKNTELELQFLRTDNDEKAWNAFLALVQVCNYGEKQLLKPSLQLLKYTSSLHFFWQQCVLKLLMKQTTNDLTCQILIFFLKQPIDQDYLQNTFEIIFTAINEHECKSDECPVFKEIHSFCENLDIKHFSIILDEVLKISWNFDAIEMIMENVLVESKNNLVDFSYFYRFEACLKAVEKESTYWPDRAATAVLKFFGDTENFDSLCKIRRSCVSSNYFWLENSENIKDIAIKKVLELSNNNSDDLEEMQMLFTFVGDIETYGDILKNNPLNIHVRLVIYKLLFTASGYYYSETKLDQENTNNDFYEYLVKHINEKTHKTYTSLMTYFLDLMDRIMSFEFPQKACSEIVNIMQYPELYSKYQVYCAAEILRVVDYRFYYVWGAEENTYYQKIALKWRDLILETEDENTCKEGLYYVLNKGHLKEEEYNEIVKKLLEKHLCDSSTEEIYTRYLSSDLMPLALKHLNDIKARDPNRYEEFSKLFCEAVMSENYIKSNKFSYENEEYKFCFLNTENLENSMSEIDFRLLDHSELKRKTLEITYEIYLNKLINIEIKANCLHVLIEIVSRNRYHVGIPPPFLEPFKEEVKFILNKCKETYKVNFEDDIIRLRMVQYLFLFIYYLTLDYNPKNKHKTIRVNVYQKLRNNLKRIAVGILVKEKDSKNNAVRQICQHMYILLLEHNVSFEDIKCITEKIKEQPDLADSFMPVLYHITPFYKFSANELKEMFEYMILFSQTQYDKLKVYSQFLFQRIYTLYNNKDFGNVIEEYKTKYEQIDLDLENNKGQNADLLGVDYIFLKILDPKRDHSLETLLEILPELNQVDPSEWKNITKPGKIWNAYIDETNVTKDKNETLKKSVNEFFKTKENIKNKYYNYSGEDVLEMFKDKD